MKSSLVVPMMLVAGCGFFGLTACGSGNGDSGAGGGGGAVVPDGVTPTLSASIGPDGGTITGEAGSPFEGLVLEFPPGAIATATEIKIQPGFDATVLPAHAERVGPQYTFAPSSLKLAKPAKLTLPVDTALVNRFGQGQTDAKVWVRSSDGWTKADPLATASGSVTISMPALATAASGVSLVGASFCSLNPASCQALQPKCTSFLGFCIDTLPAANIAVSDFTAQSPFATDGTNLYYVQTLVNPSRLGVVKRSIANGSTTVSSTMEGSFFSSYPLRLNPLVDTDGTFWMGSFGRSPSGPSNLFFKFDGTASSADDLDIGLGVVKTTNGSLVRLADDGWRVSAAGQTATNFVAWPSNVFANPINPYLTFAAADAAMPDSFWVANANNKVTRFSATSNMSYETQTLPGSELDYGYPMASAPASIGGGVALTTVSGNIVRLVSGKAPSYIIANLPRVWDLGYDKTNGGLWITAVSIAEVFYLSPTKGLIAVPTTNAAVDSDDYMNAIPRAIRVFADGSAVVLLRGGNFIHVRVTGQ